MNNIINQREVTIEFDGRKVTGAYTVWSGLITVSTALGRKTTLVGDARSPDARDGLARTMLQELALEGRPDPPVPDIALILRRANVSRISGEWQYEDYDVFDGDRGGRAYLLGRLPGHAGDLVLGRQRRAVGTSRP